jgi:hypothetical protein
MVAAVNRGRVDIEERITRPLGMRMKNVRRPSHAWPARGGPQRGDLGFEAPEVVDGVLRLDARQLQPGHRAGDMRKVVAPAP